MVVHANSKGVLTNFFMQALSFLPLPLSTLTQLSDNIPSMPREVPAVGPGATGVARRTHHYGERS
jgi:hypothetical protein